MLESRTKKEKVYNFFLIPEESSQIRKVRLSARHLKLILFVGLLTAGFCLLNVVGFWYYRSLYASLEKDRLIVKAFEQEKQDLTTKVAVLEETLDDTEQLAGRLASMVGTERVRLHKGVGPIPDRPFDVDAKTEPVSFVELDPKVSRLEDRAVTLQAKVQELYKIQKDKLIYIASTPSLWPVKGWVTSDFGYRRSPFSHFSDFHSGIDIAAGWGTPIVAPADGVVTFAGSRGGFGRLVVIDHGFGVTTRFAHTSKFFVKEGDRVKRGMKVAQVGNTGHSTGPHLHYEIHVDGVPVDPMKYLLK